MMTQAIQGLPLLSKNTSEQKLFLIQQQKSLIPQEFEGILQIEEKLG